MYPVVYLDALMVKMRHEGRVENRAVYVAIGINDEGVKEVLGLWSSANEGAKFWLAVMTELKNRGLRDVSVCLHGWIEGLSAGDRDGVPAGAGADVHRASDPGELALRLLEGAEGAGGGPEAGVPGGERRGSGRGARGVPGGERNWERVIPFFQFPEEIRRVIYTTNAVESLHMSLRKVTKNRGSFPSEEAAFKLLYLALRNAGKRWKSVQGWREAMRQFEMIYPGRLQAARAA